MQILHLLWANTLGLSYLMKFITFTQCTAVVELVNCKIKLFSDGGAFNLSKELLTIKIFLGPQLPKQGFFSQICRSMYQTLYAVLYFYPLECALSCLLFPNLPWLPGHLG